MVSRMIFQEHVELTHPQVRRLEAVLFYSVLTAGVCLTSAIAGRDVLPVKLRSALLGTSTLALTATAGSYELWRRANERYEPYRDAQERQLKLSNAAMEFETTLTAEAESKLRAVDAIRTMNAPAEFKIAFLHQNGLLDLLTGGEEVLKHKRQQSAPANVVDTTAQTVPAVSGTVQVFDDRNAAYRQGVPVQPVTQSPSVLPVTQSPSVLPVFDVAQGMAIYDGHVLVASRTGSGKTTLAQAAIAKTHNYYQGLVDFHIIDPKGASWLGLENDQDYSFVPTDNDLHKATTQIDKVVGVMQARQQQRMKEGGHWKVKPMPVVLIIDEYNSLFARLGAFNTAQQKNFARAVQLIIFQGREDNVHVWMFSQTTRVSQLGLDTSVQDNMLTIALARGGDFNSVEDAITNQYVVASKKARERLGEDFEKYKASNPNLNVPIAFSSTNSGQLVQLPDYSPYKSVKLQRLAQNQSTDEILAEPEADTRFIVDSVRDWLDEQGLPRTIQTIQTAYRAIAGQGINENGAELIRRELLP